MDRQVAFATECLVFLGILGIIAICTVGCQTTDGSGAPYGVAARAQLEFGEGAGTRNKTPQGGTYEKSGSSPTQPAVQ